MSYPIEAADRIVCVDKSLLPRLNKEQGLEIADKVGDYLRRKQAILVTGPGELSAESIDTWNNAGDWVYHLMDTTLFAEIRPTANSKAVVRFGTAGKNAKQILTDLQTIVDNLYT